MIKLQKYWLFFASTLMYYLLHEVVYGLLGFRFFVFESILRLIEATLLLGAVTLIHRILRKYLEARLDWSENPLKRLTYQSLLFSAGSAFVVIIGKMCIGLFELSLGANIFISIQSLVIDYVLLAGVIELGVLLEFGSYLLQKWNSSRIEMATFQKEKAQFSLELLRTQINPHFLFNNLNTLSALIYADQDKAADFLRKLSGVYRSILEYRNKELITLEEELRFFQQYKELLEIRFEKMLFIKVSIDSTLHSRTILPLTLQMLVENAIKHNVLSQNKPLYILIESKDDYLHVSNLLQPKEILEYSSGLGLKMIENRFAFLTKLPVRIEQTQTHFNVSIPLISHHESIDHRR